MNDTPETDKEHEIAKSCGFPLLVQADFARKMERQRDRYLNALRGVLASARPHPMENGQMYHAWEEARKVLPENDELNQRPTPETERLFYANGHPMVVVHADAVDFCERLERERDEAREALRQAHKDYGCELRDPNGTIWEHAAKLQEQLAAAKQELSDLSHAMGQLLSSERHLSASLLNLIADIRAAVGDPIGKLMQDELVEHCRALAARGKEQG